MTQLYVLIPLLISLLTLVGHVVTLPWALLHKKRQPAASVAWIMAILFIPILGALGFIVFGIDRVSRRMVPRSRVTEGVGDLKPRLPEQACLIHPEAGDDEAQWALASQILQEKASDAARDVAGIGFGGHLRQLMQLTHRVTETLPTLGNQVELLRDTNRTFGLIEQSIAAARHSVHLEYYIWQADRTGARLRDLVISKAREGVKVRFLYDGFGSSGLKKRFLQPMHDAGIHTATFLPGQTFRERWSINLRNHRKIVVVDGLEAFTGGMNIGDEYLGRHQTYRFWRDCHLKIRGPEVWNLQSVFAEDWLYATNESLTDSSYFPPFSTDGTVVAQTVIDGPDQDADIVQAVILGALNQARSHIMLETSYFSPPSSVVAALENAALRGVRVQLVVACRWTHRSTLYAGRSCYDTLLQAGVEIYEYQRGLLHSKTLTIDGCWSLVGSANLDCRSLYLNFEAGVALYSQAIAAELEQQCAQDILDSHRITLQYWETRPQYQVLAENFFRLFIPVL
jgi:cardiolipin synthase